MSVIPGFIYTDNNFWYEYNNFWIYSAPQKSEEWLKIRKGRITGSAVAENIGDSQYCSREDAILYTCGIKKKEFNDFALKAMSHGVKYEPIARDWYQNKFLTPNKMFVKEIGFLIPKWNNYIGYSPDGIVFNDDDDKTPIGLIEIKCPQKMYKDLNYPKSDKSHIKREHYQQMHLGMAVVGVKWCVYIVFSTNDNKIYTEYINFDENYWEYMKNKINDTIINYIKPNLKDNEIIIPKKI